MTHFIKTTLKTKSTLIPGFLFALSCVLGYLLEQKGHTCRTIPELAVALTALIFMTLLSAIVFMLLIKALDRLWTSPQTFPDTVETGRSWQIFLFYTVVILICWIPVFLAYYPSVFAYDAEGQLYQVLAHDYSTHHPLIHTLFLGAFFNLGKELFDSYSAGMAIHSLIQMFLMAMIFGYTLSVLYRERTWRVMRIVLLIFYALFPTNSILALSTTKDVLFAGLVLLHTLALYHLCKEGGRSRRDFLYYVLLSVLMLLFRNNAVYAYVFGQPFILYFGKKSGKGDWKYYLGAAAAALLLFTAAGAGLKAATNAQNGSPREMLSVPLQQMARTRVEHEEEIAADIRNELEAYLPSEWVFAAYDPHLADPVKNRAVIHDNPLGLIKTWARLGLHFPQTYIDAFLDNSIGYWYLPDTSHAQIYGIGTQSGFGYLSTDNRTMPAGCEIEEHSYLPGLRTFMERIVSDNEYQKIPVLSVIFAPAFYWWMLCLYIAFFLYKREYRMLLPVIFLVIYYLTLLLSPAVLIRYMYPFVVSVPAILCLVSAGKEKNQANHHSK
ncbi:MAG: DUF6020 family protein [Ruminococcus sp.]|nr:DUF6020 family protein [Ruminococcus sp.]